MRVSRRGFIVGGIASGLVVSAAGLAGLGFAGKGGMLSAERLVVRIVSYRLDLTGIGDDELLDFARTYLSQTPSFGGGKQTILRTLSPLIHNSDRLRAALPRSLRESLDFFERRLLTQFILSTDLLDESRDNKDRIAYIGYYDPLSTPCANPLTEI